MHPITIVMTGQPRLSTSQLASAWWIRRRIVCWLVSLTFLVVPCVLAKTQLTDPSDAEKVKTHGVITWGDASAPVGRFLLIRRRDELCAIKFTGYHRGHDTKPPTIFNSGEESLYGDYDWHYGPTGKAGLPGADATSGQKKLAQTRTLGIGRLILWGGVDWVKCGSFTLLWFYPTHVSFHTPDVECDLTIEMAPTRWSDIRLVNPADPTLKWYRCDKKREPMFIPVDKL